MVDAISKVMETIETKFTVPLRRRELCVLVALETPLIPPAGAR